MIVGTISRDALGALAAEQVAEHQLDIKMSHLYILMYEENDREAR